MGSKLSWRRQLPHFLCVAHLLHKQIQHALALLQAVIPHIAHNIRREHIHAVLRRAPLHTLEYEQKDRLAAVSPKSNLVF